MPSIGPMELLVVAIIALIVFGPRRLPEIARSVGKAFSEFKRQASDVRDEFEASLDPDVDEAPGSPDAPAPRSETPDEVLGSRDANPPSES